MILKSSIIADAIVCVKFNRRVCSKFKTAPLILAIFTAIFSQLMEKNYRQQLGWLLLAAALIKIVASCFIELGNDEVYYYTYALQPDYNHFDHPPIVGWLIRLTTFNLLWVNDTSLRLGAIICCAISSYYIFLIGKTISSEQLGWYAALTYNISIYSGFIAGMFILPDSPQMPFWTASLYLMSQIIVRKQEKNTLLWLRLGVLIGLACLCKVHGLYLWAGFGLFILFNRPKWLLNARLYASGLLSISFFAPIFFWNIQNQFITYKFQSERVNRFTTDWDNLLQELVGEIAYQHPLLFVLLWVSIIYLIKKQVGAKPPLQAWLYCMSLPMIVFFWGVALFSTSLPHWSGPGYIPLYFFVAFYWVNRKASLYPFFYKLAMGITIAVLAAGIVFAHWIPLKAGSTDSNNLGETNPILDISGWANMGKEFQKQYREDISHGQMQPNAPLLVTNWFPAAHELFYVCRVTGQPIIGVGSLVDLHKFAWLNKQMPPLKLGDDAYCIVPSNKPLDVTTTFGKYFQSIMPPRIIPQKVGGQMVRYFLVYQLHHCRLLPTDPLILPTSVGK